MLEHVGIDVHQLGQFRLLAGHGIEDAQERVEVPAILCRQLQLLKRPPAQLRERIERSLDQPVVQ